MHRVPLLASVRQLVPALLPFAVACYDHPTCLFGDGFTIQSTRGVQQGDVLGPALFALSIQPVLLKLQELELNFQGWYLDDGVLCGPLDVLQEAFDLAQNSFEHLGLSVNAEKCKLFLPTDDPVSLELFSGVPRVSASQGVIVLGVPIGSDSYIAVFFAEQA